MTPPVVVLYNRPVAGGDPSDAGVLAAVTDVAEALTRSGHPVERLGVGREDLLGALGRLGERRGEVAVFNLCEGLAGESRHEATVAGLLELLGLRHTGNGAATLATALDKRVAKAILYAAGIPTPGGRVFRAVPAADAVRDMAFPLVVKPVREDASLGVAPESFVRTAEELARRVAHVLEHHRQPALAEVYLEGREFNVAVVGDPAHPRVLPVAEIAFADYAEGEPRLVTHQAKWAEGSREDRRTAARCPAEMGDALRARLEATAVAAYRALECRDYARLDFRLDARGVPHVLEVNPNPDLARGAGLARAVEASGQGYDAFVAEVVAWAWGRS